MRKHEMLSCSLTRRSRRALWTVLCLSVPAATLSLPLAAGAGCSEGKEYCVRLKAGKEIKRGKCETFECDSAGSGSGFGARFSDEGGGGDGWGREGRGMYSWYNCADDEEDKERCSGDGVYLDGEPAKLQEKPVLGKGWKCYEKKGADEAMCVVSDEPMEEDKFLDLCVAGSVEEVRQALAKGADPNQRTSKPVYAHGALHMATGSEDAGEVIKLLLDAGADVNIRDEEGQTPLIQALHPMQHPSRILRPVRALLAGGADPTIKDNDGHDALWHARRLVGDESVASDEEDKAQVAEIVRLVEQAARKRQGGVRAEATADASPAGGGVRAAAMSDAEFIELCRKGTAEQVAQALKDGADARAKAPWADGARHDAAVFRYSTSGPGSALHAAAQNPNPKVTRLLLEAGAGGINDAPDGWTPLMHAVSEGNLRTTRVLLDWGADVNYANKAGNTALIVASMDRRPTEIVTALLKAGADRSHKDKEGHDALWHARNVHIDLSDHDGEKISRADLAELLRLLGGKTTKKPSANKRR